MFITPPPLNIQMFKDILDILGSLNKGKLKYLVIVIFALLVFSPFLEKAILNNYVINQKIGLIEKYSNMMQHLYKDEITSQLIISLQSEIDNYLHEKKYDYSILTSIQNNRGKFIAGSALWVIVLIGLFFSKQPSFLKKLPSIIFALMMLFISGYVSSIIPTIINPIINYIGFNVLLVVLLYSLIPFNKEKS